MSREYSTYRVFTTSRFKATRHLVVHDNLKTFTKFGERSDAIGLASVKCTLRSLTLYTLILSCCNP